MVGPTFACYGGELMEGVFMIVMTFAPALTSKPSSKISQGEDCDKLLRDIPIHP
jgi:hypothetical protein